MLLLNQQALTQSCPGSQPANTDCVAFGANKSITAFSVTRTVTNNHASGKAIMIPLGTSGEWSQFYNNPPTGVTAVAADPCLGTPAPGTVCSGGAIFLGTLSPGATSGSGTNKYMTTPGGCGEIPAGSISGGSGASAYANADFTPTCSGTDSLVKYWNNGTANTSDIAGVTNYTTTSGTGNGAINTDANYGSSNTTAIAAVTAAASGGYHAAARYCDKLSYGGYTDWYLPNRYELNLFFVNKASIPGLSSGAYQSSSESDSAGVWLQWMSDGYQGGGNGKNVSNLIRCVRRY